MKRNEMDPSFSQHNGLGLGNLWHFRLWSFQGRDTKLERFLAKNQLYSNEIPNFENWSNGELSKIGHHFRK